MFGMWIPNVRKLKYSRKRNKTNDYNLKTSYKIKKEKQNYSYNTKSYKNNVTHNCDYIIMLTLIFYVIKYI